MTEGTKHDQEKNRLELIPAEFVEATAYVLTWGARKYQAWNWKRGIVYSRCFGALLRHLYAWWRGEDKDPETGYSHLWHASCELMFLIYFEIEGKKQLDDRPKKEPL